MCVMMSVVMMVVVAVVVIMMVMFMVMMFMVMIVFMMFVNQSLRCSEPVTHNALSVYGNERQDSLHSGTYDVDRNARVEQSAQRHIAANSGMTVEPGCFHGNFSVNSVYKLDIRLHFSIVHSKPSGSSLAPGNTKSRKAAITRTTTAAATENRNDG